MQKYNFMRYIAILILLSSCSVNQHLWLSKRHLDKAIRKGAIVKSDTVYKTVEVFTERYQVDTLLQVQNIHDTIRFENERVKWKTKYDTINKTVFVDVECKPDTIKVEVPISVTTEVKPEKRIPWFVYVIGLILCFLVFFRR